MRRSPPQTRRSSTGHDSPAARLEREATRIAHQRDGRPAGRASSTATHSASRGPDDLVPAGGRPLHPTDRRPLEARFGRDFSGVRIHADAAAATAADRLSAEAYTVGEDIVFGAGRFAPETREGGQLLAHELAHAVQQQGTDGWVQRQPQAGGAAGIGSAPPSVPFSVAEGVGPEDEHVLFAQNHADLSAPARRTLAQILAGRTTPVTVSIHGYASTEGDLDYNSNLSAHRAAAVRLALLPLLPAGSVVELYAHGETVAFGEADNNRRAGVQVTVGVPANAPAEHGPNAGSAGATATPGPGGTDVQPATPGPRLVGRLFPPLTLRPVNPLTFSPGIPITTGTPQIDWLTLRQPFLNRGVALGDRERAAMEQNWSFTYSFLLRLGLSPGLASSGANAGTAFAYDTALAADRPTAFDRFQHEDELMRRQYYPGEIRTPIVPIITPGILNGVTKYLFGRDVHFEF